MKKIKIGINGFGRIGRLILRVCSTRENIEVVAINDPFIDAEYGKYLLCHDSIHGQFNGDCSVKNNVLNINKNSINFYEEKNPELIPWAKHNVDVVIEASGKFTKYDDATKHIQAGAKKVIVTAPGKDMPTFVMGVNNKNYKKSMKVISNASCTTNCLAPLLKVIDDNFGVEEAFMSTIHSTTATQLTVDGPSKKDWRGGRAASYNIIPSSTGAAKAVAEVLPNLKNKISCMSYRVPTLDVSVLEINCKTSKNASIESIANAIQKASKHEMKGVIGITNEPVVSSDFIGEERTCVVDLSMSAILSPKFIKIIAWYDNEWGYSCKTVDLCEYISR